VPLVGVAFLGWSLGEILLLYWTESAIIGAFNAIKMSIVGGLAALYFVPFFCFHYGLFMLVHLVFLAVLFLGGMTDIGGRTMASTLLATFARLLPAVLALLVSHLVSFLYFFRETRERGLFSLITLMGQPYQRIVLMQFTIICGGVLYLVTGRPLLVLALMVLAKTVADLWSHLRQHRPRAVDARAVPLPFV
jgi:hypothetical protein